MSNSYLCRHCMCKIKEKCLCSVNTIQCNSIGEFISDSQSTMNTFEERNALFDERKKLKSK